MTTSVVNKAASGGELTRGVKEQDELEELEREQWSRCRFISLGQVGSPRCYQFRLQLKEVARSVTVTVSQWFT